MAYENFRRDLKRGQAVEEEISDIMEASGWKVSAPMDSYPYDRAMGRKGRIHLVEIKNEENYANSGNIVVEMHIGSKGKKSGILKSDANIYIHYLGEDSVIYKKTDMLVWVIKSISERRITPRTFPRGDDFVEGVVLNIDELSKEGIVQRVPTKSLASLGIWEE